MDSDDIRSSIQADIDEMDKAMAYLLTLLEKLSNVQGGLLLVFQDSNDGDALEVRSLLSATVEFGELMQDQFRSITAKLITLRDKPR